MARSVSSTGSRRAGPKTKHDPVQAGQKGPAPAREMPGRAVSAKSMIKTLERTIRSVIRDNFVGGSIDLDPPNTENDQIMFKVTDMPKYADVRGLSTAGVYVTGIATHQDVPEYMVFAYVERGRKPKAG